MGASVNLYSFTTTQTPHPHPSPLIRLSLHSPHDYCDKPHYGFIETIKEVPEGLSLLPHVPDDQAKAHGEHHQAESVDPIHRPRHRDHLLPSDFLATVECEYCVIHCHLHMNYPFGILGLELD